MQAWIRQLLLTKKRLLALSLFLPLFLTPACQPERPLLEQIKSAGELIVATQVGPTTYYQHMQQATGFEYELARQFAQHLNVQLKIVTYNDLGSLLKATRTGEVHLAAAGLMATRARQKQYRFSSGYQQSTQQLVYHKRTAKPINLSQADQGTLAVVRDSNHAEQLQQLKAAMPSLNWEEKPNTSTLQLLDALNRGTIAYTLVDSNVFEMHRDLFPELRVAFDVSEPEPLAWAMQKNQDSSLHAAVEQFLQQATEDGRLSRLQQRFYGHQSFDYVGARTFNHHIEERLPAFKTSFRKAAVEVDLDWRLLAAIGYQESLWNPKAISPTGVRGLMMLTRRTAKEMGIKDRRDPGASIMGGSRYFKKLYDRLPRKISKPDRLWFALAAYNMGYGHLMDARRLTTAMGGNKNSWFDVRKYVPLLKKPAYYKKARYGRARSANQAVTYVRNIRRYYEALVWETEKHQHQHIPVPQNLVAMLDKIIL